MTADEINRPYALRKDIHKAELVQGIVYMPAPVRISEHAAPDNLMNTWIANTH